MLMSYVGHWARVAQLCSTKSSHWALTECPGDTISNIMALIMYWFVQKPITIFSFILGNVVLPIAIPKHNAEQKLKVTMQTNDFIHHKPAAVLSPEKIGEPTPVT